MRRSLLRVVCALGLVLAAPSIAQAAPKGPLVLAAASLQDSLTAAANAWAAQGHSKPVISFGASSALARQIEAGAPADLFVSADEPWMDDVERHGLLRPGTRATFLANSLVLIAPAAHAAQVVIRPGFPLARLLGGGHLAMADPAAVPAGRYGKAALEALGVWPQVEGRVASGENVRTALTFVDRGEAPLGIVYATDAYAAKGVRIVGVFPPNTHPPITYPIAVLKDSRNPEADRFRRFLVSPAGKAIFRRYGFVAK